MPWPENEVLMNRIARYGLPILVLIFYLQSARFLDFTPDFGFVAPTYAAGLLDGVGLEGPPWDAGVGTPSPLWVLFVAAGGGLGIDLLLTAKIFGLFFACLTVLVTYLLASEVLGDRILSLCIALLVATAPWLMMSSVAGGGITLAMTLSLAGLFFHVRGDFLLGVLMAALASLVLWPALILGVLCVADDMRRAPSAGERRRRATIAGLLLVSVLAVWGLLAWKLGAGVVPLAAGTSQVLDPVTTISVALLAGAGLVTILVAALRRRIIIGRTSVLPFLLSWCTGGIVAGVASGPDALLLVFPLLVMTGYLGMVVAFPPRGGDGRARMGPVFALTAALLLANQAGLHVFTRPAMLAGELETAQMEAAASWVRASGMREASVASDRPWTVLYITRGSVLPYTHSEGPKPDIVVLSHGEIPGYLRVYRAPIELGPGGAEVYGTVSVWTKTGG